MQVGARSWVIQNGSSCDAVKEPNVCSPVAASVWDPSYHIPISLSLPQSPGFILLRDQTDGRVYFLPPDESGRLMQVRSVTTGGNPDKT